MTPRPYRIKQQCKRGHDRTGLKPGQTCPQCNQERYSAMKADPTAHAAYKLARKRQHRARYQRPEWRAKFLTAITTNARKRREKNPEEQAKMEARLEKLHQEFGRAAMRQRRQESAQARAKELIAKADKLAREERMGIVRV